MWSVQTFTSCTFIAGASPPPRLLAPHGPNPLMCDRYDVLRAGACFFSLPKLTHAHSIAARARDRIIAACATSSDLAPANHPCAGHVLQRVLGRLVKRVQKSPCILIACLLSLCTCQVCCFDVCMCLWLPAELSGTLGLACLPIQNISRLRVVQIHRRVRYRGQYFGSVDVK